MRTATLFLSLLVLPVAGCKRVECGDGTTLADGYCQSLVECGPGTMESGGECVPEDDLVCGEGTVRRGDECEPVDGYWIYLPFEEGFTVQVSQGNHGGFSHSGSSVHALDFALPEGTPIHAVAAGRVARVKEDSDEGCGEPECSSKANYVLLDHGDGTISRYVHLQIEGADVEVGDAVERGQQIGRSGNTGFSTGPHLHLAVTDLMRQSLPMRFEDLREISDGAAFAGPDFASKNAQIPNEVPPEFSDCPADLFSWMGITLEPGFPCVVAQRDTDYTLGGTQHGDDLRVVYGLWNSEWQYGCDSTGNDGRFEISYRWDSDTHGGLTYIMVGAGEEDCSFGQGWGAAPSITLVSP